MTAAAPQSTQAGCAPCPFCGSKDVELSHTESNWPAVGCNECGALGPCTDLHSDKAIEAWNTRASMQRAEARSERVRNFVDTLCPPAADATAGREEIARVIREKAIIDLAWEGETIRNPYEVADAILALSKPPEPPSPEVKR